MKEPVLVTLMALGIIGMVVGFITTDPLLVIATFIVFGVSFLQSNIMEK